MERKAGQKGRKNKGERERKLLREELRKTYINTFVGMGV